MPKTEAMKDCIVVEPDADNNGIVIHIANSSAADLGDVLELAERIDRTVIVIGANSKTCTANMDAIDEYPFKPDGITGYDLILKSIELLPPMLDPDEDEKIWCQDAITRFKELAGNTKIYRSIGHVPYVPQHHNREYRSKPSDDY
jgi:hypothetical protein